jgi:hypothetical protein
VNRLDKNKLNVKTILVRRAYQYNTSVRKVNAVIKSISNIKHSSVLSNALRYEYKIGIPYNKYNFLVYLKGK